MFIIYLFKTTSDLINQIKQIKVHHYFDPVDVDFDELIEDENEIEIYYSDASGIEKSELIKNEFNKKMTIIHIIISQLKVILLKKKI